MRGGGGDEQWEVGLKILMSTTYPRGGGRTKNVEHLARVIKRRRQVLREMDNYIKLEAKRKERGIKGVCNYGRADRSGAKGRDDS